MIKSAHYKVENFFNSSFVKDLVKISIFRNSDGSYELFDRFIISTESKKYIVTLKHSFDTSNFYTLQNAVTWCIFSQKNKIAEANRILYLDKIVEGINFSITSLKSKLKKTDDLENITIYSCKLSQDEAKRQKLLEELFSYRTQAHYWQTQTLRV